MARRRIEAHADDFHLEQVYFLTSACT
jgi:hypothetical protein